MLIIGLSITLVTPGIVQARDHHAHSHHGNQDSCRRPPGDTAIDQRCGLAQVHQDANKSKVNIGSLLKLLEGH